MVGGDRDYEKYMAETISSYALTTLQRVKDRLYDATSGASQPSNYDAVLIRMINSCTEWFERECGNRKFIQRTHTNDIYSAYGSKQNRIVTRQAPIFYLMTTGNTVSGSTSITSVANTTGMVVGMPIYGDNLTPTYTSNGNQLRNAITAISGSTVTVAAAATSTASAANFTVNGLILLQWRAGTPATGPAWTSFIPDQYEVVNNGAAGVIRIYGVIPRLYNNMIRISYSAGYPVNWANAGDDLTHKLPADISDTIENLVVRVFKRRMFAGKVSEALEGATSSWSREIDVMDKDVIGHYRRMPTIF